MDLKASVERIEQIAQYNDVSRISTAYREAESLIGLQNYAKANTFLKTLEGQVKTTLEAAEKTFKEWELVKNTVLLQLASDKQDVNKYAEVFPNLTTLHGEMNNNKWQFNILNPLNDTKSRDYAKATIDSNKLINEERKPFADLVSQIKLIEPQVNQFLSIKQTESDRSTRLSPKWKKKALMSPSLKSD